MIVQAATRLLVALSVVAFGNGWRCNDDDGNGSEDPPGVDQIANIAIGDVDPDGCYYDPCCVTYTLEFLDRSPDDQVHYYWAEIVGANWGERLQGRPVGLLADNTYKSIEMAVCYFDYMTADEYTFEIYRVDDPDDVHNISKATASGSLLNTETIDYTFYSNCGQCYCSASQERFFAFAGKQSESVTGVRCSLETSYGMLCGESFGSNDTALSLAWIGINQSYATRSTAFVQAGYGSIRGYLGYSVPEQKFYLEAKWIPWVNTGQSLVIIYPFMPNPDSDHYYELVFDSDEYVRVAVDGTPMDEIDASAGLWESTTGNYALWSGEIRGRETDMPGTVSDSCDFTDCQFRRDDGQGFRNVSFSFPPDQIGSSDWQEWGIAYVAGGNWFRIWDVNPQPR